MLQVRAGCRTAPIDVGVHRRLGSGRVPLRPVRQRAADLRAVLTSGGLSRRRSRVSPLQPVSKSKRAGRLGLSFHRLGHDDERIVTSLVVDSLHQVRWDPEPLVAHMGVGRGKRHADVGRHRQEQPIDPQLGSRAARSVPWNPEIGVRRSLPVARPMKCSSSLTEAFASRSRIAINLH